MYKTVIFDLDGTLLDTLQDLHSSVNAALAQYGLPSRSIDEVRCFIGNGIAKLVQRAIGTENQAYFDGVLSAFKAHYGAHCKDKTSPYEGVLEVWKTLKAAGVKTAVVSNKPDALVKALCEKYFDGLIDVAIGENEAGGERKKPAPDGLKRVLQTLGNGTSVYIGDSDVDVQTAKNTGIDCISVSWGFRERAFLLERGATKIVDKAEEIF